MPLCNNGSGPMTRLSGPGDPQQGCRHRIGHDALGRAATATHGRAAGHEYPQHIIAALAHVAQDRKPLPGPRSTVSRTALPTVTMRSGNISFAEVLPKWEGLSRKATTAKSVSATLCNTPALLPVLGQRYEEKILLACSLCQKQFKIGP